MSLHHYRAYGLKIASEVPLPALAPANGEPDVVVRMGTVAARRTPGRPLRFYGSPEDGRLYADGVAAARIREGREIVVAPDQGVDAGAVRGFLLGPALGILLTQRGWIALHASAVIVDGQAVAIAGGPGSGKSTLAAALDARGHAMIADDIVAVILDGDAASIIPGFPQTKLWPDAAAALGDDPRRLERVRQGTDKLLRPTNRPLPEGRVPLAAIFVLEHSDRQAVESLRPSDAVIELLYHSWTPRSLHAAEPAARLNRYTRLVALVPVRRLRRAEPVTSVHDLAALVERERSGW